MRKCEQCHGPGPARWSDREQRYLCVKCHEDPNDEFFTPTGRIPSQPNLQGMPVTSPLAKRIIEAFRGRCPHGNKPGECQSCDVQGDLAYDAAREDERK